MFYDRFNVNLALQQSPVMAQSSRPPSRAWGVAVRNPFILLREVGRSAFRLPEELRQSSNTQGFHGRHYSTSMRSGSSFGISALPVPRPLPASSHSQQPSDECLNTTLSSRLQSSGSPYISRWPNAAAVQRWCTHRGLHRRPVMTHRVGESWQHLLSLSPNGIHKGRRLIKCPLAC